MGHEHCALPAASTAPALDDRALLDGLHALGPEWAAALDDAGDLLRERPTPDTWSALEYAAHSRDITVLHVWAVHRGARRRRAGVPRRGRGRPDPSRPAVDYVSADPADVVDDLEDQADRLAHLADHAGTGAWDRGITFGTSRSRRPSAARARVARLAPPPRRRVPRSHSCAAVADPVASVLRPGRPGRRTATPVAPRPVHRPWREPNSRAHHGSEVMDHERGGHSPGTGVAMDRGRGGLRARMRHTRHPRQVGRIPMDLRSRSATRTGALTGTGGVPPHRLGARRRHLLSPATAPFGAAPPEADEARWWHRRWPWITAAGVIGTVLLLVGLNAVFNQLDVFTVDLTTSHTAFPARAFDVPLDPLRRTTDCTWWRTCRTCSLRSGPRHRPTTWRCRWRSQRRCGRRPGRRESVRSARQDVDHGFGFVLDRLGRGLARRGGRGPPPSRSGRWLAPPRRPSSAPARCG